MPIKSTEIEKWFLELRKGNPQKKVKAFADPTVDKIRRIMHLVYKHGQRREFLPRQQEGNPMNWVSQRTTAFAGAYKDKPTRKSRKMSAKSRAKIVAAQRARWAKVRKQKS